MAAVARSRAQIPRHWVQCPVCCELLCTSLLGRFICFPAALKIPSNCSLHESFVSGCLYCIFLLFIPLLPLAAKSLPHLMAIWHSSICILSLGTFQHAALLPFLVWGFTTSVNFHELCAAEVTWESQPFPILTCPKVASWAAQQA